MSSPCREQRVLYRRYRGCQISSASGGSDAASSLLRTGRPAERRSGGTLDSDAGSRQSLPRRRIVAQIPGREGMDPRPHIVVVDDEATQRQLLADYLAGQNFRVSATDGGATLR